MFAAVLTSALAEMPTPDSGVDWRALLGANCVRTRRSPLAAQGSLMCRARVLWGSARLFRGGPSAARDVAACRWRTRSGASRTWRPWSLLLTGSAAQPVQDVAGDAVDGGVSPLPDDHGPVGGGRGEDRPGPGVDAHRRCPRSGDIWLSGCAVPVTHPQVIDILVHGIEHHDAQNQKIFRGAVRAGGSGQAGVVVVEGGAVTLVPDQGQAGSERVRRAAVATVTAAQCLDIPTGERAAR